jgi:hypothetical protein
MKNLNKQILLIALLLIGQVILGQAPSKINYQAVARNISGNPLISTPINVLYEIRQSTPTGLVVYSETHNTTTNQFGLFNLAIGSGAPVTGTFGGINWSGGLYYLQITINGDVMPATQLLSVPYALHANTAATGSPGANGHNGLTAITIEASGVNCANGGYLVDVGTDDNDDGTLQTLEIDFSYYVCNGLDGTANINDTSATNEIQALSISNDTLFLTGGGYVILPAATGDDWGAEVVNTIGGNILGDGTSGNPLTVVDNDTSSTNEIELPATAIGGQVLTWDGTAWVAQNAGSGADNWGTQVVQTSGTNILGDGTSGTPLIVVDNDTSATNEFQDITFNSTDSNRIDISNGSGIYLSPIPPLLNQVLTWNGGGWIAQTPVGNTDNQDLQLLGNTLSLTNDGTPVDLTPFMDNTDAQILVYNSATQNLSITNGNAVTLVVDDADNNPTNEYNSSFGVNGGNLELVDGGNTFTVPLSSLADGDWTTAAGVVYNTTDDIGIGTNIPGAKLDISSTSFNLLNLTTTGANSNVNIDITNTGSGAVQFRQFGGTGGYTFYTNGGGFTPAVAISDNNRVGLDLIAAPLSTLDVNGQITMRTGAINGYIPVSNNNGTMTWTDPLAITTSDDGDWIRYNDGTYDYLLNDNTHYTRIMSPSTTSASLYSNNNIFEIYASGGDRAMIVDATYMELGDVDGGQFGNKLIIDPEFNGNFQFLGGNVGIGTTAPAATLDVLTANSTVINAAGSNAVGTIIDVDALNGSQAGVRFSNAGARQGGLMYDSSIGALHAYIYGATANDGIFLTNGTYNVGIGTNNPSQKFHVEGTSYLNGVTSIGGTSGLAATLKVFSGFGAGTAYFFDSGSNVSMSILSGGDVVIGGSNGVGKLLIQDTDANTTGASGSFINIQNLSNTTNTTAGIRFRTGGSTAVNGDYHYKGAIFFEDGSGSNGEGDMIFAVNNAASSTNVTTSDASMTISSTGDVGIGTNIGGTRLMVNESGTNPVIRAQLSGTTNFMVANNGNTALYYSVTPAYKLTLNVNSAAKPTSSAWTVASDKRLKTDVQSFSDGLNVLMQINPVWFSYTGEAGMPTNERGVGTLAQELQTVAPYMVNEWVYVEGSTDENSKTTGGVEKTYLGVDYGAMDFVLINAIKEQQKMIEELKQNLLILEKQIEELKNK